jgi:hypothetical protein
MVVLMCLCPPQQLAVDTAGLLPGADEFVGPAKSEEDAGRERLVRALIALSCAACAGTRQRVLLFGIQRAGLLVVAHSCAHRGQPHGLVAGGERVTEGRFREAARERMIREPRGWSGSLLQDRQRPPVSAIHASLTPALNRTACYELYQASVAIFRPRSAAVA